VLCRARALGRGTTILTWVGGPNSRHKNRPSGAVFRHPTIRPSDLSDEIEALAAVEKVLDPNYSLFFMPEGHASPARQDTGRAKKNHAYTGLPKAHKQPKRQSSPPTPAGMRERTSLECRVSLHLASAEGKTRGISGANAAQDFFRKQWQQVEVKVRLSPGPEARPIGGRLWL